MGPGRARDMQLVGRAIEFFHDLQLDPRIGAKWRERGGVHEEHTHLVFPHLWCGMLAPRTMLSLYGTAPVKPSKYHHSAFRGACVDRELMVDGQAE
jgi:hypothetical protein